MSNADGNAIFAVLALIFLWFVTRRTPRPPTGGIA